MNDEPRIIAVDPMNRGFGYVVFEGPERLIDWGTTHARRNTHNACLDRLRGLLERYAPGVLVLENWRARSCRRCARVRRLLGDMKKLATSRRVSVRPVAAQSFKKVFTCAGAFTKDAIAAAIASRYPDLEFHLPPPRKPWMTEDTRTAIFDAAALALVFFGRGSLPEPASLRLAA